MVGPQLIDLIIIHAAAVGQTIFLGLWLTLPWWRAWVGRALMVKSSALWVLLVGALVNYWIDKIHGPYPGETAVVLLTHVAVLIGVWSQVFALGWERNRAAIKQKPVSGTVRSPREQPEQP